MQGGVRVIGSFVYPKTDDVRLNGKVALRLPANRFHYYVDLKWDDVRQTWRVLDFIYAKKKKV